MITKSKIHIFLKKFGRFYFFPFCLILNSQFYNELTKKSGNIHCEIYLLKILFTVFADKGISETFYKDNFEGKKMTRFFLNQYLGS